METYHPKKVSYNILGENLAQFLSLKKGQEIILEPVDENRLQIIVN